MATQFKNVKNEPGWSGFNPDNLPELDVPDVVLANTAKIFEKEIVGYVQFFERLEKIQPYDAWIYGLQSHDIEEIQATVRAIVPGNKQKFYSRVMKLTV